MFEIFNENKGNIEYINKRLNDERFYNVLNRIDSNPYFASVETAMLDKAISNGFATYLILQENLKKLNLDNNDKNIISSYVTAVNGKEEIKKYFSITKDFNLKLDIDYRKESKEVFDEILKTYTSHIEDEVTYTNNKHIKDLNDLINFSFHYFDTLESNAKQYELKKKDVKFDYNGLTFIGLEYNVKSNLEKVTFDDIGGLKEAKREFRYLAKGLKNPKLYKEEGIHLPKGVIIWGSPGVGKTELVKALAYETGWPLTYFNIASILSKYFGQSSKNLVNDSRGPGIKFYDELDTLGRARGMFTSEGMHTVVNTFNQILNEYNPNTFFIGATNRLEDIDPAIRRAGRFDKIIPCPRPDQEGIIEIFNIHKNKAEELAEKKLFSNLNYNTIARNMEMKMMAGADINEIIRRTLERRVYNKLDGKYPKLISTKSIMFEINRYERSKNGRNNTNTKTVQWVNRKD